MQKSVFICLPYFRVYNPYQRKCIFKLCKSHLRFLMVHCPEISGAKHFTCKFRKNIRIFRVINHVWLFSKRAFLIPKSTVGATTHLVAAALIDYLFSILLVTTRKSPSFRLRQVCQLWRMNENKERGGDLGALVYIVSG